MKKEEQITNQLPADWKWLKLGDACKVITGTTPPKSDPTNYGNEISFFKPPHLWDRIIIDTEEKLSYKGSAKSRTAPANTVLVTCIGNLGRTGLLRKEAAFNQQINAILENEHIFGKYIFYLAQSPIFKKQLEKLATGTTVSIVNKSNFETIKIPVPSISIQHIIVSKIDELFSELDKGIEQLKTVQQQLKTYRQAVLKWAFEGRLTNENVKDGELPDGWKYEKLETVCAKIQDGSHFSPQIQYETPGEDRFKYITAKNIRNNYMDLSNITYVNNDFHKTIYARCNPEFGDVLLTKDGVNTGEVTLNTLEEEFSLLSSVCLFKTNKQILNPSFLKYYIQSPPGSKRIIGEMSGTAIKRIVLKKLRAAEIMLPHIEEQQIIVNEIEKRLSLTDKLEETIMKSLQQSELIRQSILKMAFEGKLLTDSIETVKESMKDNRQRELVKLRD